MLVAPSEKVTTPVGLATAMLPGALTVTVAVNVTVWPATGTLTEDMTSVLVLALPTVCVSVPLLLWKLLSPAYEALIVWLPTTRLEVVKLAVVAPPEVLSVPCPMLVAPSDKITAAVGIGRA